MFFKHIEAAPADPILGLGEAFKAETRPEKVNLGIGVYKDASGATPIVKAVKEAEKRLLESETTKNYLTIDGVADYNEQTQILLFGKDHEIIASRRAKTAQSLGGTGALRIAYCGRICQTPVERANHLDFQSDLAKPQRHRQSSRYPRQTISLLRCRQTRFGLGRHD